ncbi:acyltransferase family protein [Chlamydia ibidis]|uniref:Acyltransferase family protein n=2 Tax=Chlamydia ibidis TaxID=1405396 RepID=S7KH13_9CHLA|nr:lysophospholipid acyltransferase family protein [Chlamydia ibidis]EPP35471.1 acyltransferase family protein [Chlamydia ibidis]EQM63076.1 acyltransferase family protein [Chlamydia ibidis 10-1398/6]
MIFAITKFLTNILFRLLYRFRVYRNKKSFCHGPAIVAANHASFLDPVAVVLSFPGRLYHLARSTLFSNVFSNWLLRQWACYPVNRSSGNSAAFKAAYSLFQKGQKLIIYPEGSRSPDGHLHPGQIGVGMLAIKTKVPVLPVYVAGTYQAFNRHQKFPKFCKPITCIFGSPVKLDDLLENTTLSSKEIYQIATDRIMTKIAELKSWYENGCIGEVP